MYYFLSTILGLLQTTPVVQVEQAVGFVCAHKHKNIQTKSFDLNI